MKSFGKDDWLWIETATAGTFAFIKGQGDMSMSRSRDKVDLSDKTTAGWKQTGYALSDMTISLKVQPDLPDMTGFTRLVTQANAQPPVPFLIQIRPKGAAGLTTDAIFAASVYAQISNVDYPTEGVREVTFEFGLAAAPTVDTVAA